MLVGHVQTHSTLTRRDEQTTENELRGDDKARLQMKHEFNKRKCTMAKNAKKKRNRDETKIAVSYLNHHVGNYFELFL